MDNINYKIFVSSCENYKNLIKYLRLEEKFLNSDLGNSPLSHISQSILDSILNILFPNINSYEDDIYESLYDFIFNGEAQGMTEDNQYYTIFNYEELFNYITNHNKRIGELRNEQRNFCSSR